ncbi:MAG TPA: hypothetical protein VMP89_05850 [Solirubrobacteraceae bacterium]|nr:hypothetical protein [Solirubrobacteraceae bacterium]
MKWTLAVIALAGLLAGCGFNVQSADLFLLTRTGHSGQLTLLVNDGGTIRCNGRHARPISDPLLLEARDLAGMLDGDAKAGLRIAAPGNSVYRYRISLQGGTIAFPDTAAASGKFPALAQAELFTVQAAQQACGLSG